MAETDQLIQLAVFGLPVAHSLSPLIHRQFAQQCGLKVDYRAIETHPAEFADKVKALVLAGGRGCNITVPLKHEAWQFAQRSSPSARQAQAANTLLFEGPENCYADNTDGRGLVQDLARHRPAPLRGSRILILGAGGAAAGILGDLLQHQPAEIMLGNRSPGRAQALALRFQTLGRVASCGLDALEKLAPFDLIINATSLGHQGQGPILPASLLQANGLCYDLNYGQAAAPLRSHCERLGMAYQDGLGMLVEQAAASFLLWTGMQPETAAVLQSLRQKPAPLS